MPINNFKNSKERLILKISRFNFNEVNLQSLMQINSGYNCSEVYLIEFRYLKKKENAFKLEK